MEKLLKIIRHFSFGGCLKHWMMTSEEVLPEAMSIWCMSLILFWNFPCEAVTLSRKHKFLTFYFIYVTDKYIQYIYQIRWSNKGLPVGVCAYFLITVCLILPFIWLRSWNASIWIHTIGSHKNTHNNLYLEVFPAKMDGQIDR